MNTHLSESQQARAELDSAQLRLRLLQVAGGNPDVARQMKAVMWQDYCEADQPFGASEQGMLVWMACAQRTTSE